MQQKFFHSILSLMPTPCISCGYVGQGVLCDTCCESITKPKYICRICGCSMAGQTSELRCKQCLQNLPAYESLHYIGRYDDMLSALIIRAKIGKQLSAILALQRLVSDFTDNHPEWKKTFSDYHLLPMPIPRSRLMQRGFNLPLLLAKTLSKQCDLPIMDQYQVTLPFFVKKQAKLNRQQRLKNRHLYHINKPLPEKIIIVDDIVTTGTTVNQLSKALRRNNVERVAVWAMARVNYE